MFIYLLPMAGDFYFQIVKVAKKTGCPNPDSLFIFSFISV